jgi:hypothetical protein
MNRGMTRPPVAMTFSVRSHNVSSLICRPRTVQSNNAVTKKSRKKVNRLRIAICTGIPAGERRKPATRKSTVTIKTVGIA